MIGCFQHQPFGQEFFADVGQFHGKARQNHDLSPEHTFDARLCHLMGRNAPDGKAHIGPGVEIRFHRAGTKGGYLYMAALPPQFFMDGFRQAQDVVFRGVIGGHQRPGQKTGGGGNVEDIAMIPLPEILQEQLGQDMHRPDVQIQHIQFCFQRYLPKPAESAKPGVIDEDIDILLITFISCLKMYI